MNRGAEQATQSLIMIQRIIKNQLRTKDAKVEVIENYWDKLFGSLLSNAIKHKDTDMKVLCNRIVKIPREVKMRVLTLYVRRCRDLYQIAFFQWRKKYPNKIRHDIREVEELIEFRIKYQYEGSGINMEAKPSW